MEQSNARYDTCFSYKRVSTCDHRGSCRLEARNQVTARTLEIMGVGSWITIEHRGSRNTGIFVFSAETVELPGIN